MNTLASKFKENAAIFPSRVKKPKNEEGDSSFATGKPRNARESRIFWLFAPEFPRPEATGSSWLRNLEQRAGKNHGNNALTMPALFVPAWGMKTSKKHDENRSIS
jgi:hypothetical protein